MAVSSIVFSRDRPAQLDLFLRSLKQRAKGFSCQTHVLWQADPGFEDGYEICAGLNPQAIFRRETDFREDVYDLLKAGADFSAFFCDDDVFWRPMLGMARPDDFLLLHPEVLTVSLRLGRNTTECYPLRRSQEVPEFIETSSLNTWLWRDADGDFGYPGSLDGNVWRRDQLRVLISDDGWANPNRLEDELNRACRGALLPYMGCYHRSYLVGSPNNIVNESHPNRHGETHGFSVLELNERFLAGQRLEFPSPQRVTGAHQELPLKFIAARALA